MMFEWKNKEGRTEVFCGPNKFSALHTFINLTDFMVHCNSDGLIISHLIKFYYTS